MHEWVQLTLCHLSCLEEDFVSMILQQCGPEPFASWSQNLTLELVSASKRYPLIPGFYKMLKEVMLLCGLLHMFKKAESALQNTNRDMCTVVLQDFLLEVIGASRRYDVCFYYGHGTLTISHCLQTGLRAETQTVIEG